MSLQDNSLLPYIDNKPVGAADFYFAINATFRFMLARFGIDGLRAYWTDLGHDYFAPVADRWRAGGLEAIAAYWNAFFTAEPEAKVSVAVEHDHVVVEVHVCPAIHQLRSHHREIVPCFCQHCYFINQAIAEKAGFTARVEGGNGSCQQIFYRIDTAIAPQDLNQIKEAKC